MYLGKKLETKKVQFPEYPLKEEKYRGIRQRFLGNPNKVYQITIIPDKGKQKTRYYAGKTALNIWESRWVLDYQSKPSSQSIKETKPITLDDLLKEKDISLD